MSHNELQEVAQAQAALFCETDPELWRSIVRVMHLLVAGEPVSLERFAASTGLSRAEAEASFADLRAWGAEFDEAGNVVGAGLTLVPTTHHYEAEGRTFSTWCAQDAVTFPLWLGHTATITSSDPVSGEPVRLTVGPEGVKSVEPASIVVSLRSVGCDATDVRGSVCQFGQFFASSETADKYAASHGDVPLNTLTPEETFRVGQLHLEQEPLKSVVGAG